MDRNTRIAKELLRIARSLVADSKDKAIGEATDEINKLLDEGKITASRGIVASSKIMNILLSLAFTWRIEATGVALRNSNLNSQQIRDLEGKLKQKVKSIEKSEMKWHGANGSADIGNGIYVNVSQDGDGLKMEVLNKNEVINKVQINVNLKDNYDSDRFEEKVVNIVRQNLTSMMHQN